MVNFKNKYAMMIFTIPKKSNIRESERKMLFNVKMRFYKVSGLINGILRNFTHGK
jgi:hypothetical protein